MATSRVNRFSSKLKILNITFNCLYLVNRSPLLLWQVQNIITNFRQKVLSGKEKYFYLDKSAWCRKFLIKSDKLARHLQVELSQDWAIIQPVLYIYNYGLVNTSSWPSWCFPLVWNLHIFSFHFNFLGMKKTFFHISKKMQSHQQHSSFSFVVAVSEHFRADSEALAELHGHFNTHL